METDRLMGHLLPGSTCIDEDALFIGQDDHSTCLDTSIWDLGADDSSRVSAREDTTAHIGYNVIQREITSSDVVQWHIGVPNDTIDSGQFNMYLMQRVFLGTPELTLAGLTVVVRDMRWHLSMTMIRSHTT